MITPTQLFLTCARRICVVLAIWALAAAYGAAPERAVAAAKMWIT